MKRVPPRKKNLSHENSSFKLIPCASSPRRHLPRVLYDLPPVRPLPLPPDGGAHADAAEAGVSVVVGVPVGGVGLAGAGGGTGGGVVWQKRKSFVCRYFF